MVIVDGISQWEILAVMRQRLVARRARLSAELTAIDARLDGIETRERALRPTDGMLVP